MIRGRRLAPLSSVILSALLAALPGAAAVGQASAAEPPLVYRCQAAGTVVFADRPCADPATAAESGSFHLRTDRLNGYAPPGPAPADAAHPSRSPSATARAPPSVHAGATTTLRERRRQRCEALQQRIDRVNSLMRAGYRGARGERLRAQWSELKTRYYDEKCLGAH